MPYSTTNKIASGKAKKDKNANNDETILSNNGDNDDVLIAFYCRHVYHLSCALPDLSHFPPKPESVVPNRAAVALGLEDPDSATTQDQALSDRLRYTRELRNLSTSNILCKVCRERSR